MSDQKYTGTFSEERVDAMASTFKVNHRDLIPADTS